MMTPLSGLAVLGVASDEASDEDDVIDALNLATGVTVAGEPGVGNGYQAQTVDVVYPDGTVRSVGTSANASAAR